jgi:hypothetical protein
MEYAALNLLPEVREPVLALFRAEQIAWHAGICGGPSNHLLSSQVQCVNALGQMMTDAARIYRSFGMLLDTDEVLELAPGSNLTFEFVGPTDFFGEARGGRLTPGAHCTSVDAAFLHRTNEGITELVLIEWKYTESYSARRPNVRTERVRWARYGAAWTAPDGPVRSDLLGFNDVLDEPLYQLVRQQLLAHELEKAHAYGADRVRVLHVLPAGNAAYQQSLSRATQCAVGCSTSEVWRKLLRSPSRFVTADSARFLNPGITSAEYVQRYGG